MKQTAVEWLIDELELDMFATDEEMEIIIKSKEMEIKQNHSEYMRGWKDGYSKNEPK
jgi:hypothetical protein